MRALLELLLSPRPAREEQGGLAGWWRHHRELVQRFPTAADQAIAGGFIADRLGYAFASGYQAAGAVLLGERWVADHLFALCATEEAGAHPRAIEATVTPAGDGFVLSGKKCFVTLGPAAERLVVIAREGVGADGRPRLRAILVPADRAGLRAQMTPDLPFVPEIPHGVLSFEEVAIAAAEVLSGDGYSDYLKPFRTIEDAHVEGALLGLMLKMARLGRADDGLVEQLIAMVVAVRSLCGADPNGPGTHLALAGSMATTRELLDRLGAVVAGDQAAASLGGAFLERWRRDRPLLAVAAKARESRRQAAWRAMGRLGPVPAGPGGDSEA